MTLAQCHVISFEVCKVLSVSSIITVILLLKHSYCEKKKKKRSFLHNIPLVLVKAVNGRQHPFQKQTAGNRLRRTALSQGGEKFLAEQANGPMVCRCTLASQIDLLANGMGTSAKVPLAKRPPVPHLVLLTWSRGGPPQ